MQEQNKPAAQMVRCDVVCYRIGCSWNCFERCEDGVVGRAKLTDKFLELEEVEVSRDLNLKSHVVKEQSGKDFGKAIWLSGMWRGRGRERGTSAAFCVCAWGQGTFHANS